MQILNTYHTGYPDLDGIGAAFLTVLTRSSDGSYAVYSGVVALRDFTNGDATQYAAARDAAAAKVARSGSKESFARAVTFYPALKREEYRV